MISLSKYSIKFDLNLIVHASDSGYLSTELALAMLGSFNPFDGNHGVIVENALEDRGRRASANQCLEVVSGCQEVLVMDLCRQTGNLAEIAVLEAQLPYPKLTGTPPTHWKISHASTPRVTIRLVPARIKISETPTECQGMTMTTTMSTATMILVSLASIRHSSRRGDVISPHHSESTARLIF